MRQHVERNVRFVWTTLIGGVVFLFPLAVVGWIAVSIGQVIWSGYGAIRTYLTSEEGQAIRPYAEQSLSTYLLVLLASLLLLVGVCFVAGLLARRSLGRWFSERAERYLAMLFPRYVVFKDQLAGNLGQGTLSPVLARIGSRVQIGAEVERTPEIGVTVYLPGSPDPWTGTVAILPPEAVTPIEGDFAEVMATFEQLGRGTSRFVRSS